MGRIVSVQIGQVAPLGPQRVASAFVKKPVGGAVQVSQTGLAGDAQADRTVHGDAAKAVYVYPLAHYAGWHASHPQHAALWEAGGVGENLTVTDMLEDEVCIGDVVRAGSALLQVSQPREPCLKFALRFADPLLPKAMIGNGRSGWYCLVLAPGAVRAGDEMALARRLNPGWTVARMNRVIHAKRPAAAELSELAGLPGLARVWERQLAR